MTLVCEGKKNSGRGFVLLSPSSQSHSLPFRTIVEDPSRHQRLLSQAQRLRGQAYLRDGAIRQWELTADGRHVQPADALSWHLLTVDENEKVAACLRYCAHEPGVSWSELAVSRSAVARSADFGRQVKEAIQAELAKARQRAFRYVELGGWAISDEHRCTTEALRMLMTVYALGRMMGGALGVSTATTRHHSSSILRRVGGRPLSARGSEIPPYLDPHYDCEMELLSFDSTSPDARYSKWIGECCDVLRYLPVISPAPNSSARGLLALHHAVRHQMDPSRGHATLNLGQDLAEFAPLAAVKAISLPSHRPTVLLDITEI